MWKQLNLPHDFQKFYFIIPAHFLLFCTIFRGIGERLRE